MNGAGTAPPKRTRIAPVDTDPDHDELSTRSEPHVGICRQNSMLRKAVLRVQMKKSRTEPVNSFSAAVKAAQVASQASQSFTNAKPHSSHIVDCNRKFCAVARLLTVKKARKRSRKYSVAAPAAWMGAAKLDRNVGDTVVSVAVSDDDSLFAAGANNKKAVVYSTSTGEVTATFTAKAGINAVVFAGIGAETRLIVGTFNSQIAMWPIDADVDAPPEVDMTFGGDAVLCMAVGARGTRLAVGGNKSHIALYAIIIERPSAAESHAKPDDDDDLEPDSSVGRLIEICRLRPSGPVMPVASLSLDRDATLLVAGGESKLVHLWDISDELDAPEAAALGDPASTTTGGGGGGGSGGAIKLPPITQSSTRSSAGGSGVRDGGRIVGSFRCASGIHSISLTAGGDHLAVGLSDCTECYSLTESNELVTEEGASRLVRQTMIEPLLYLECSAQQGGVAFSKEGGKLAIGGNQLVTVFDIISGGTICKMPRGGRVRCVALSSTGGIVVVGGFDRKVTMHNICAGTELYHFAVADDVVRSVHLSADSSRLAIGSDKQGKGCVCLYDAHSGVLVGEWEHPKAVWCVRLSPDSTFLAAAGYDMKMTLYDTVTLQQLQQIAYPPKGPPAFVWTMAFSQDGARLALGCWNGGAYLYRVEKSQGAASATSIREIADDGDGDSPPRGCGASVVEIAVVERKDRVYSVDLDAHGRHMCIGGRDKTCSLFEVSEKAPHTTSCLWEVLAEDFVYAVALSPDLKYCVYGGTFKSVIVVDARTGVQVCRIGVPGTIWTISMLADSSRVAFGGELPTLTVYDLQRQCDELQLPVDDATYGLCISPDAVAFTNGNGAAMYGKGGTEYAWKDPPSFGVVASLIMTMLANEEDLLHCTSLIINAHPAVVNSRDPDTGGSLLQFVISNANRSRLLDVLLAAQCRIGLQADARGRTCLHQALENGKWHSLQQLLDALRHERFSVIPGAMQLVAECFEAIATDYPLDFLHYVSNMPLDAEPEVLGDIDAFDVMLPSTLICGSSQRCPKGIWNKKLEQYSRSGHEAIVPQGGGGGGGGGGGEASPGPAMAELSEGSKRPGTANARPGSALHRSRSDGRFKSGGDSAAASAEAVVEMGYNKISRGGLQAHRVPIENFAGILEGVHGGSGVSPLRLIVDAVDATSNYSVFSSHLLSILIEFKWYGFARNKFYMDVVFALVNVAMVVSFHMRTSATIEYSLPEVLGLEGTQYAHRPEWFLLLGWSWTSLMVLKQLMEEIRQMSTGCIGYWTSLWNWIDWFYILAQATVNVIFMLRDYVPYDLIFLNASDVFPEALRRLEEEGGDGGGVGGVGVATPLDWHAHAAQSLQHEPSSLRARLLRSQGGSGGDATLEGETFNFPGLFIQLQSLIVLLSTLRILYFFKGSLKLGALTHTLGRILVDIMPLMILLAVFVFAFTGSMMLLLMAELEHEYHVEWHTFTDAVYSILNMGLYTTTSLQVALGRHFLLIFIYMVFMLMVQIIILNMLIAIMAESHNRIYNQSGLVAQKGRAELILEYELSEVAKLKKRATRRGKKSWRTGASASLERVCPKWLHVLMPAEHQRGEDADAPEELKQIRQLRKDLARVEGEMAEQQTKMLSAIGKRDEQGERQRMLQAIRVELSSLRDEVVASVKKG